MAQTQPKNIGLIGLSAGGSWASRSHLGYLTSTSNYKITALQNSSKASADAAAKTYNLDSVATHGDPTALANDSNVDIVAVSVNVPLHYDLVKPALETGKDVFVEWPLARNLSEAEEMLALAKQKNVRTMVGLQARQSPTILKAREIVQSGKLGQILNTTMYGHGLIFGPALGEDMAYALPLEAGANLLTIPFGHAVDALCYVLGELESLTATLANYRPEITMLDKDGKPTRTAKKTAHDQVSVTGTLVNGGIVDVTYAGGVSRTGRNFYWEINGTNGSLVLEGSSGHIQMFQPTIKLVMGEMKAAFLGHMSGNGTHVEEMKVEKAGEWDRYDFSFSVGKAWDAWAGVGAEEGYSVTTFEDAVLRHKMIDAIYRSAEKGTKERYL
jgi:predicted dehydrogenase